MAMSNMFKKAFCKMSDNQFDVCSCCVASSYFNISMKMDAILASIIFILISIRLHLGSLLIVKNKYCCDPTAYA